jgi:hypothetical protein
MMGRHGKHGVLSLFAVVPVLLLLGSPAWAQDDPWGGGSGAEAPSSPPSTPSPSAGSPPASGTSGSPAPRPSTSPRLTEEELAARRLQGQQNKELLTVEQDVSTLKERVFRSKATLQLLRELVIEGATIGSRVSVWHVDRLSGAYTVESVQYFLDGKAIFSRTDTAGGLDKLKEVELHAQTLPPGAHNLQVNMVLRGNGMGVFSYLRSYSFKVQSSYTFNIEDGKLTVVRVTLNEKGGPFTSFVDRPTVGYEEAKENLRGE